MLPNEPPYVGVYVSGIESIASRWRPGHWETCQ
jgi:hypothetical protein